MRRSGEEDGILTALEASLLNLWGSLRRALVLAGSETQVMSLWPVDDAATRDLMIAYYRAVQAGQLRGEGLRQTQLRMLENPNTRHPFFGRVLFSRGNGLVSREAGADNHYLTYENPESHRLEAV